MSREQSSKSARTEQAQLPSGVASLHWSYQLSRVPKSRPLFSKFTYRFGLADADIFPQAQSQWEVVSPGACSPRVICVFYFRIVARLCRRKNLRGRNTGQYDSGFNQQRIICSRIYLYLRPDAGKVFRGGSDWVGRTGV